MQRDTQKYSQYSNNGKFGVLLGRRILVPAEYDLIIFTYCWNNLEGLPENTPSCQLSESLKERWIIACNNPEYGYLRSTKNKSLVRGETKIFDLDGQELHLHYHNERIRVPIVSITQFDAVLFKAETLDSSGKSYFCLFKDDGDVVIPFKYQSIKPLEPDHKYTMQQSLVVVGREIKYGIRYGERFAEESGKYGVIDLELNEIVPVDFDKVVSAGRLFENNKWVKFYGDYIIATRSNKMGLFLRNGELLFPCIYTYILVNRKFIQLYFGGQRLYREYEGYVKDSVKGGKWAVYLPDNMHFSKAEFDAVYEIGEKKGYLAAVVKNGEAGYIDINLNYTPSRELDSRKILHSNVFREDDFPHEDYQEWTQRDYEEMNRGAFEGEPDAEWNID